MALLVYVDDIVLPSNDTHACSEFKNYLCTYFNINDLKRLKYFLDIEMARGLMGSFLVSTSMLLRLFMSVGFWALSPVTSPWKRVPTFPNISQEQTNIIMID